MYDMGKIARIIIVRHQYAKYQVKRHNERDYTYKIFRMPVLWILKCQTMKRKDVEKRIWTGNSKGQ